MTRISITDKDVTSSIYGLFNQYNSFVDAKGARKAKAIEWAIPKFNQLEDSLGYCKDESRLLQSLGWNTFVGFGLYSGLVPIFNSSKIADLRSLSYFLIVLLRDIVNYTDVGHIISSTISNEHTSTLRFARTDSVGNIYIFPTDVDALLDEIDWILIAEESLAQPHKLDLCEK